MRMMFLSSDVCSSDLAIRALPPFSEDRVFLIEDTAELQCSAADKEELLTKTSFPPVTMTDLVRDSLRLRPDRIIIGEVRDGSALDLLNAWNTGHPGGLATIHANSAMEGLTRLEDLIGEGTDRHSAVWGKSVSVCVDLGGRRILK